MIINRSVIPLLWELDTIIKNNRQRFSSSTSIMLFHTTMDFLRYWRHLESQGFRGLKDDATDELYYQFTQKLRSIFDCHIDLFWLIDDIDGKPLYKSGRAPADFWMIKDKLKPLMTEKNGPKRHRYNSRRMRRRCLP